MHDNIEMFIIDDKKHVRQNATELAELIELFRQENVRSYLEIGCRFGGSLWHITNSLPEGSTIVAIDLPHINKYGLADGKQNLEQCVKKLKNRGYNIHLFLGDSTASNMVERVKSIGPFDACFIDANHTLPYVTKDWENYGPMARIVCFHDISWYRASLPPNTMPINVPEFWQKLKPDFKHREIKYEPQDNGIGILWH